jgi:hypothetical protein
MAMPILKQIGKKTIKAALPHVARAAKRTAKRVIGGENVGTALKRSFSQVPMSVGREVFDSMLYNGGPRKKRRQSARAAKNKRKPKKRKRTGVKYVF